MGSIKDRTLRSLLGDSDATQAGYNRTLRGLRVGDRRELVIGLILAGVAYLQRSKPRRELLLRKEVPEGSALVIHHKKRGAPRLEIIKPPKGGGESQTR